MYTCKLFYSHSWQTVTVMTTVQVTLAVSAVWRTTHFNTSGKTVALIRKTFTLTWERYRIIFFYELSSNISNYGRSSDYLSNCYISVIGGYESVCTVQLDCNLIVRADCSQISQKFVLLLSTEIFQASWRLGILCLLCLLLCYTERTLQIFPIWQRCDMQWLDQSTMV